MICHSLSKTDHMQLSSTITFIDCSSTVLANRFAISKRCISKWVSFDPCPVGLLADVYFVVRSTTDRFYWTLSLLASITETLSDHLLQKLKKEQMKTLTIFFIFILCTFPRIGCASQLTNVLNFLLCRRRTQSGSLNVYDSVNFND